MLLVCGGVVRKSGIKVGGFERSADLEVLKLNVER